MVSVDAEAIPAELKDRDQWLMWDASADTPRRPHWRGNFGVSWSDPDDWHSFEDALDAAQERESWGIGYVFAQGIDDYARGLYGALDLDGCVDEDGSPKEWLPSLEPFFDADAFVEYSPSGEGIHIPIVGFEEPEWWTDSAVAEHEGVEAYDKKFFTFTGDTLRGSGETAAEMSDYVIGWLKEAYEAINGERPWEDDEPEKEVSAPSSSRSTGNAEEIATAVNDLDARDVAEKTIVSDWNDDAGTSGDNRAFYPTWGPNCNGTANIVDRDGWTDTGTDSGSGGPLEMAAIDMGELSHSGCSWGDVSGELWWDAVDHLRNLGFRIPEYEEPSGTAPTYDEDEVERGEQLLAAECSRTRPAGEMDHQNGHYGYWYEKREGGEIVDREFRPVTNFTLETLEHLETDEGDLLKLRVHPAHPMEDEYDVDVHPTVFNETRTFKEEIVRGRTTRYEPGDRNQQALNDLRETVGSQMVPKRVGVEHIGLAGEDYDEWVSPKGTLTADGLADDPEHRYYAKGGSSDSDGGALARKWQLDPETLDEYADEDVAEMLELLPKTRRHDRGLPILGWFYSAPLRPLIHDWEGEFNLLQVVGSTGTGKTSTLKAYWEALGMEPDPFSASATPFTLMKHMSSSSGVPVWIDEYKPADIRNDRLDTLHRRLREVTKGGSVSKGRANLGEVLFDLKAPVVVSGEQKFAQNVPAVRRRAIMTTLSEAPTRDGSEYTRAFCELTGTPYEDENGSPQYPEGYDLADHARAYYRFILGLDKEELREVWNNTRKQTGDMLSARGLTLEKTEFQGAQTILFGVRLFRMFAEEIGADATALPTDDEVADAFEHYASNIGKDGKRMGYDDSFLELFAQAASEGYLERDYDFRFIQSNKYGGEVLAFHMPSADAAVRRYVRDYNLEDEYTLVGKTDVLAALRDKVERNNSHVHGTNVKQRLEGGYTKCVVIDPHRTREVLGSGFDLRAFGRGESDGAESAEDGSGDGDGGDGSDGTKGDAEPEQPASATAGDTSAPAEAATDGGLTTADEGDLERLKDRVRLKITKPSMKHGDKISVPWLIGELDADEGEIEACLEDLAGEEGLVDRGGDDYTRIR